ncbi:MAG: oligosaccharide flippase family protein [Gammaproteobacteria bacterium]|nr:oligosaccharide flippase family protein [Gammaproteobacteria bacterium]MBU1655989.1 oligosaccharide flippase family protein [Gammaproteobacteria bacterium]MBU1962573.1 oligosaccharide flippase family protein [Gammaproteobacteria bacterium]
MTPPHSTGSFRSRILKASFWAVGGDGISQAIRLGSNLIMTRLLAPEMFGVMALVTTLMVGLTLFSDLGLRENIIQNRRGDDPRFLNTVWSIQVVRGFLIWFATLAIGVALFLAGRQGLMTGDSVYADPVLPLAILVTSVSAIIFGFQSTRVSTAARHLAQKQLVLMEIYSQLLGLGVMIAWALIDRSIWALVAGGIAGYAARTALSHLMLPGPANRWEWDPAIVRELFQFGKWIFLSSLLGFLAMNSDRLLLAGFIGSELMGVYSIAFLFISALQMAFMKLNGAVAFPALSEVQRERGQELKQTYYNFRLRLDSAILAVSGALALGGDWLIELLYDHRYAAAGDMLQVLAFVLIAQIYGLADQCFLALGKPKLLSLLNVIRAVAIFALVPLGFKLHGMDGALWGIVLSYFAAAPVSLYLKARQGLLNGKREAVVMLAAIILVTLEDLVRLTLG